MKTILFAGGQKGLQCLGSWNHNIAPMSLLVLHPESQENLTSDFLRLAEVHQIQVIQPEDPNLVHLIEQYKAAKPDLFVLAGYENILIDEALSIPFLMTLGLHAGKLPQKRGSSPLFWSLMEDDSEYTLTVYKVTEEMNAGDVLSEKSFPIGPKDTIMDLQQRAYQAFPMLLSEVLDRIHQAYTQGVPFEIKQQARDDVGYYFKPLSGDGLIVWDMFTAREIHNRIRAWLSHEECAYSFYDSQKVYLMASELCETPYYGMPGRIQQVRDNRILVSAKDSCLWITDARLENGKSLLPHIKQNENFTNLRELTCRLAEMTPKTKS